MTGESVWKFRSGDAVIGGIPNPRPKFGIGQDAAAYDTRHLMFGPWGLALISLFCLRN